MAAENPYQAVSEVLQQIGLNRDFVIELLREDDWSYVIKANALSEAAVTRAIVRRLGEDTDDFVTGLSMSQRLKLAEGLSLFPRESLQGARGLTKLRNRLAHDVTKVDFTFSAYLEDSDQKNEFFGVYLAGVDGTIDIAGRTIEKATFFRENPKWAVNDFLFDLMLDVYVADSRSALEDTRVKLTEQLFAELGVDRPPRIAVEFHGASSPANPMS